MTLRSLKSGRAQSEYNAVYQQLRNGTSSFSQPDKNRVTWSEVIPCENAASRIAQLNILDAVFVAVAQRDYRVAERNLAKTMAAVSDKRKAP
jgi:DNA-binding MurR/RpiR family transcriptional regulator